MTVLRPGVALPSGLIVLVALVVCAVVAPQAAAAGWLVGFVFWMQVLAGSLCLMMIHRLTSGDWGDIIAPVTGRAAAAVPFLILLIIPLFVAIPALYPWAQHPSSVKPDVLSAYLNQPTFILRSLVTLAGWSVLAFVLPRMVGARGQLWAAIGLVFYAVTISGVSIDWYLSVEAPFTSSSFGASVAISSLVAALSWAAVWMPAAEGDPAIGDVGALLLATVLGLTYIDFMAVLVIWYGDLPREEIWFATRGASPWMALGIIAFILASLFPTVTLIQSRFRNHRQPLRHVGAVTLAGLAVYDAYLVAAPFGVAALGTGLLAVVGIGLVLLSLTAFLPGNFVRPSREAIDAR